MSVPRAPAAILATTAAADPPEEPPGIRDAVPRVAGRPEVRIVGGHTEGQLVGVGLAEEHSTGVSQTCRHRRVDGRHTVAVDGCAARGGDPCGVDQVLQRDRDTMEGATDVTASKLLPGPAGILPRSLDGHFDKGIEAGIDLLDPGQVRIDQLTGRDVSSSQGGGRLGDRKVSQLHVICGAVHGSMVHRLEAMT